MPSWWIGPALWLCRHAPAFSGCAGRLDSAAWVMAWWGCDRVVLSSSILTLCCFVTWKEGTGGGAENFVCSIQKMDAIGTWWRPDLFALPSPVVRPGREEVGRTSLLLLPLACWNEGWVICVCEFRNLNGKVTVRSNRSSFLFLEKMYFFLVLNPFVLQQGDEGCDGGCRWRSPRRTCKDEMECCNLRTVNLYKLHGVDVSLPFPLLVHIFTCDIPSKWLSASEMVKGC